jgi:murein DD-endopeptidase MepM/ murein hydrolase activator NlpD
MAAVHGLDGAGLKDILPGYATRREHAQAALYAFDGLDGAEVREGRAWAEAYLPPAEPSVLVHGDLLGQNILLDHGAGIATRYGHLQKIGVTRDQRVERGQLIGLTGNTGRSTGPHLHYEVLVNGRPVDPRRLARE